MKTNTTKQTSRRRPRTPAQLEKDAARLFDILNSAEVPGAIRYEIAVLVMEHVDAATRIERSKALFIQAYTLAAKDSGDERQQRELERILNQLDAGKSLESVVKLSRTTQPQEDAGPNFADLALHISSVLADPQTPVDVYNSLTDQLSDLCNPYLKAIHETPDYIEKALIFNATGEAESAPTARTDERQHADLARAIHTVLSNPAMPEYLRDKFQSAYVDFESTIDIAAISQTPAAIRHALDLAAQEKGGQS